MVINQLQRWRLFSKCHFLNVFCMLFCKALAKPHASRSYRQVNYLNFRMQLFSRRVAEYAECYLRVLSQSVRILPSTPNKNCIYLTTNNVHLIVKQVVLPSRTTYLHVLSMPFSYTKPRVFDSKTTCFTSVMLGGTLKRLLKRRFTFSFFLPLFAEFRKIMRSPHLDNHIRTDPQRPCRHLPECGD